MIAIQNSQKISKSSSSKKVEKMSKMTKRLALLTKSLILILLLSIGQQTRASGVFELELVSLQQIDSTSRLNHLQHTANNKPIESNSTNNSSKQQTATNLNQPLSNTVSNNLVRIFVCLKEAFTSKLDGPCTFGNASITLNRDSIQTSEHATSATSRQHNQDHDPTTIGSRQQQLTHGSQLTNIVRILFTFRWTKSFTIILTAEQIDADNQQPSTTQNHPLPQEVGSRLRGANINGTNHDWPFLNKSQSTRDQINGAGSGATSGKFQFIDRHVLTENEVLPNLEPNPNKPWATRFSRSLKSSLAYRFRIYCSLNYYGDGCTTFCRPRDDQFGHYNCSSTGQKVCLDGWHGADCDKARCRPGCNQQHGYCEKPDTCQCRPGWAGLRCDECITYPGCQNGYCLSPWQCMCQRNWGGVLCDQDLNYCGTHEPCKNNGTCQNIAPGKYKCTCPEGFTGVDCDINLDLLQDASKITQLSAGCALNPCLNGGTCFGFNSAPIELYNRETKINDTLAALNGNIERGERIYRCQCPSGWTGDYCQWQDNSPMLITTLLLNYTQAENKTNGQQANITENSISTFSEVASSGQLSNEDDNKIFPTAASSFIESVQLPTPSPHLDMKHLISGVVVASVFGVFLASLLLAWCCLVAIERNKLPFIQMNIIRNPDGGEGVYHGPAMASTLRRMHGKIRDSLRLPSRSRIKPETKLSIENVLRPPKPPPSYEESNNYQQNADRISIEYPIYHRC